MSILTISIVVLAFLFIIFTLSVTVFIKNEKEFGSFLMIVSAMCILFNIFFILQIITEATPEERHTLEMMWDRGENKEEIKRAISDGKITTEEYWEIISKSRKVANDKLRDKVLTGK